MRLKNEEMAVCIVIGASHAGVNFAFALRKEGWQGRILLFDADPEVPYHRPPLSKAFLTADEGIEKYLLKPIETYAKEGLELFLGQNVAVIDPIKKVVKLQNGDEYAYDFLVLATGARPLLPPIPGLKDNPTVFPLRTAQDVMNIRNRLNQCQEKKVVVIGGGYIGLEIAASLNKLGAKVSILEREERVLARITAKPLSDFFTDLHIRHGVAIHTQKNVSAIHFQNGINHIECSDGTRFEAEMIVVGVGIVVNTELAQAANINIENGILINEDCRTSNDFIYAIGDCTRHFNPHYQRYIRLESVQNAVDQAKIAAATIAAQPVPTPSIPWFWSDQYDIKLQIVGLSAGYNEVLLRNESDVQKFSLWYFKDDILLAVDAINNAKAYVMATKIIRDNLSVNKKLLTDPATDLKHILA